MSELEIEREIVKPAFDDGGPCRKGFEEQALQMWGAGFLHFKSLFLIYLYD